MRWRTHSWRPSVTDWPMMLEWTARLGDDGGQAGGADRAAEIAQHVEQARRIGGVLRAMPAWAMCGQRRQHQGLADGADDVGGNSWSPE